MTVFQYVNDLQLVINASVSLGTAGASQAITVVSSTPVGTITSGSVIRCVLGPETDTTPEYVDITAVNSSTSIQVTRAVEGTLKTHAVSDAITSCITAGILANLLATTSIATTTTIRPTVGTPTALATDQTGDFAVDVTSNADVSGASGVMALYGPFASGAWPAPIYFSSLDTVIQMTSSATATVPPGVHFCHVIDLVGGGGSGGSSAASTTAGQVGGSGGGAGQWITGIEPVTPGDTITYTQGTGGAGVAAANPGASGNNGVSSTLTNGTWTLTANPGHKGLGSTVASTTVPNGGGAAGTASQGDGRYPGFGGGGANTAGGIPLGAMAGGGAAGDTATGGVGGQGGGGGARYSSGAVDGGSANAGAVGGAGAGGQANSGGGGGGGGAGAAASGTGGASGAGGTGRCTIAWL